MGVLDDLSFSLVLGGCALLMSLSILYVVLLAIYRFTWHPLATFPGPKLAAASGWYETYYDCFLLGKFSAHMDEMHKVYGPIVRINPWEVHIKDPKFFDKIYTMTPKLDKDPWYYNFAGIPKSAFATPNAHLHRLRRAATSKLFSNSYAMRMQPLVESCVAKMMAKLERDVKSNPGQPANMSHLYWCMASEVVSGCMLPHPANYLEGDNVPQFGKMFKTLAKVALWNRHVPWLFSTLTMVPRWIVKGTTGAFSDVLGFEEFLQGQVLEVMKSQDASSKPKHSSVPFEILQSSIPSSEKSCARITQEATMIVGAGTEATGAALSITTFYLLSDPAKMARLKQELATLQPSFFSGLLSYEHLVKCPYLSASISEGLRLSKESNRMPRISYTAPTTYRDWVIPPGTAISMSLRDVHLDASVFEDPRQFQPERWLSGAKKPGLERFLVPFNKGTRGCVGMHLALIELYLTIGNLFHRFDMELFETTEEDIRLTHDFFSLDDSKEAQGLRVRMPEAR